MSKYDEAIDVLAELLRENGWEPVVMSGFKIEQGTRKLNFRLVFDFTGKQVGEELTK